MKNRVVPIKNIFAMREAADALLTRSQGMPGMGLIYGPTGYGKTTATTWLVNQVHGVYVRSMALWSPKTMLEAIARELDICQVPAGCKPVSRTNPVFLPAIF